MIQVNNLGRKDSIFNQFIAEIRDAEIQKDRMRFRNNLVRLGEIMAYEISKALPFESKEIITQLGVKEMRVLSEQPVIATILRAGLPFHQGFLNMFDKADSAFIAAYRKYDKNEDFEIKVEHFSSPKLENRILVLCDPMLATGESLVKTLKGLLVDDMCPREIHIAVAIASVEGIDYVKRALSRKNLTLWVGAIDDELTARAYIVPGLGDAGDLAYGVKR
jgi:Uracil phosphoribosyltransferase